MSNIGNKEIMSKNLLYYMEKSGKSQKEIAEIVGVSTSAFSDWITGKKYPRIDKIEILANYFGILKSDLIEAKEEKSVADDGLSDNTKKLIEFAKSVPEDKVDLILRVMRSIVEDDL